MASSSDVSSASTETSPANNNSECTHLPRMQTLLYHPALQCGPAESPDSLCAARLQLLMAISARSSAYDIDPLPREHIEQQLNTNMKPLTDEEWALRFQARLYSVLLVKNKGIYNIYITNVPRHLRDDSMPQTPRCDVRTMSTRMWRYVLRTWDENLKQWYSQWRLSSAALISL